MNLIKLIYSLCICFLPLVFSNRLTINGNKMLLDDTLLNNGTQAEGLMINSRMVQGISDGFSKWPYPDTKKWDANRNVAEFVSNMENWKNNGLNGFTIGMQGGGPASKTSGQTHKNSAFDSVGNLKTDYMNRLNLVMKESNRLDMIVILSLFYRSQVGIFKSYDNVLTATTNTLHWLQNNNFTNVIIEPANECEFSEFSKVGLGCDQHISDLIDLAQIYKFPAGNSYKGSGHVPSDKIIQHSQVIFLHGNSMTTESSYKKQLDSVKKSKYYKGQPIVCNEAGTSLFLKWSIDNGVGWGYYDQGKNNYKDGYQSPPVNWGINTKTKKAFFAEIKNLLNL